MDTFIERFREALKIPTCWPPETASTAALSGEAPLIRFQQFLVDSFPLFNKTAERYVLNPYSVLYRWPGTEGAGANSSGGEEAVMFLAHYDVVPVEKEKWNVDPFGAEVKDGFIYGRGSLDMKSILISIMEAAENLCAASFRPRRDIWFAFGGDEERAGILGAREAAKWFTQRGQKFAWILDEGTPVGDKQVKGIDSPFAMVSIEEKGFLSLDLTVAQDPGHASKPPEVQAAAVLAAALCRIAKKPFPFRLTGTVERFFGEASLLVPGFRGFVMRHPRLFGPLFFKIAGSDRNILSMLRTTVAMTQLKGSAADNVLPSEAKAVINLRLLQPWTVNTAIEYIKKIINDKRVTVSIHGLGTGPVPANAAYRNSGWQEIKSALEKAWPGIPMFPFIMTATTDSRHFKDISGSIFRFSPHRLEPKEMAGIHGHNERISEENLRRALVFYTGLLESL